MDKITQKIAHIVLVIFILICAFIISWHFRLDKFHYILDISSILLLGIVLKRISLLGLSLLDAIYVISILSVGQTVLSQIYLPQVKLSCLYPLMLLLLISLLFVIRVFHKRKTGSGIIAVFSTIVCTIIYALYQNAGQFFFERYWLQASNLQLSERVLQILAFILIAFAVSLVSIWLIIKIAEYGLKKLQSYSVKYKEIDRSAIFVLALTLCCMIMTELLTFTSAAFAFALPILWISMCLIIALIQMIYIRLLVKSISLKEEMLLQENDWKALTQYNKELESNMEDLRAVKHDIKNLFLTMGGFVEKSDDAEMKSFYEKNIVPFAKQEVEKSDLYAKLTNIHDESMKSFLYFKIMQSIEQNIKTDLKIQFENETMGYCMAQTDLIRILGILIDNAIEEAKTCNGSVTIEIKETQKEYNFLIRNSTRYQIREKGVIAGTTDKGLGRGNGLIIAEKIIQKYKNVLLNSFFQKDDFVQYLRIEKI